MSGGSYDYAYIKIENFADEIRLTSAYRRAFVRHLKFVARAAKSIEWNDSGDGDKDEEKNIQKCLGENADLLVLKEQVEVAENVCDYLSNLILKAKEVG